jgi:hypothetical protein
MTPDLQLLRKQRDALDVISNIEFELVDDPAWGEPSDTSYLSKADRANPDIMANVAAMAETNQLISWFGQYGGGYVGLWRGPEQRPLERAPIVRLDTEGQYELLARSIGDFLAVADSEECFKETRAELIAAGFTVSASRKAIWKAIGEPSDLPNQYRDQRYRHHLAAGKVSKPATKLKAGSRARPAKAGRR